MVNSGKRDLEDYNHLTMLSSKHLQNSPSHKGVAGAGRPSSLLAEGNCSSEGLCEFMTENACLAFQAWSGSHLNWVGQQISLSCPSHNHQHNLQSFLLQHTLLSTVRSF